MKKAGGEVAGATSAKGADGAAVSPRNVEMQQLCPSDLSWPLDGMDLQWPDSIICI